MNVYVTLHTSFFLDAQREAICRHVPNAAIHLVATGNARNEIKSQAMVQLPQMTTAVLVPALIPHLAPGPGMVLEWDIVPTADLTPRNAVNVEPSAYGIHPSVLMWTDPSLLRTDYLPGQSPFVGDDWETLPTAEVAGGCGQACQFRTIGGQFLHFHHWAAGRRPFGLSHERVQCWRQLLLQHGLGHSRPGLGDMVATGLAAVGITPERVEAITGKPCGCKGRQEALNALGRRIGIG